MYDYAMTLCVCLCMWHYGTQNMGNSVYHLWSVILLSICRPQFKVQSMYLIGLLAGKWCHVHVYKLDY